jgi:hypothetical protein
MNTADRQIERERSKHERLLSKLQEKARRRQEQAHADYLFVLGMDHNAPWRERDHAAQIISAFCAVEHAYSDLLKLLSSNT